MSGRFNRGAIATALVLLVVYAGYRMFGAAVLVVSSEPADALVRIDGRAVGRTPVELVLTPGTYRLQVQHHLFVHANERIELSFGETLEKNLTLKPGLGTMTLLSNPRGAWVEVDGERLPELTPTSLTLATGEHEVRMGLAERHAFTEIVSLRVGQTKILIADLDIDPHGSINFSTRPAGGSVEIVHSDIVYAPGVRVPIGEYRIRITKRGYITQEVDYYVRYGENHYHVVLEQDFGVLALGVDPPNAEVRVTYADLDGKTTRRIRYAPEMRIPVGRVSVRARAMGKRSVVRDVDLTSAGATLHIRLKTLDVRIGRRFRDALKSGGRGPLLVNVPPGEFVMGDPDGARSERPARTVVLTQPFAVSVNEITMGEYLAFARATGKSLHDRMDLAHRDHPVRRLYWSDAREYTQWLSRQTGKTYRLPTETEWEYIARAGTQTDYYFGDDVNELCRHANFADRSTGEKFKTWDVAECDDGFETVAPVGSLAANAFGLHDVYGNVSEWVLDCGMKSYGGAPSDGSVIYQHPNCVSHGYRGGSWDSDAVELRSTYRNASQIGNDDRGLRVLREL